MKKRITQNTYDLLLSVGHAVPRDNKGYIQTNWRVGGEYMVYVNESTEPLKVRCTQNCPHNLQVKESPV